MISLIITAYYNKLELPSSSQQ